MARTRSSKYRDETKSMIGALREKDWLASLQVPSTLNAPTPRMGQVSSLSTNMPGSPLTGMTYQSSSAAPITPNAALQAVRTKQAGMLGGIPRIPTNQTIPRFQQGLGGQTFGSLPPMKPYNPADAPIGVQAMRRQSDEGGSIQRNIGRIQTERAAAAAAAAAGPQLTEKERVAKINAQSRLDVAQLQSNDRKEALAAQERMFGTGIDAKKSIADNANNVQLTLGRDNIATRRYGIDKSAETSRESNRTSMIIEGVRDQDRLSANEQIMLKHATLASDRIGTLITQLGRPDLSTGSVTKIVDQIDDAKSLLAIYNDGLENSMKARGGAPSAEQPGQGGGGEQPEDLPGQASETDQKMWDTIRGTDPSTLNDPNKAKKYQSWVNYFEKAYGLKVGKFKPKATNG